jgi:restriction system protein
MPIPDYQALMLPVLKLAAKGETSAPEVEEKIADEFGLTPEERAQLLPSGRQRTLHNRVHWAKFYMTKAGLLDSPKRGRFIASASGRTLLATNPDRIDVQRLLAYPSFQEFSKSGQSPEGHIVEPPNAVSPSNPTPKSTPEEQIESAYAAMQSALKGDLLQRILANSPSFFEELIVELLVAMGYGGSRLSAATQLGRSGDGGVDGVINEDRLGLDRVYVQAKRYKAGTTVDKGHLKDHGNLTGHRVHGDFPYKNSYQRWCLNQRTSTGDSRSPGAPPDWKL